MRIVLVCIAALFSISTAHASLNLNPNSGIVHK